MTTEADIFEPYAAYERAVEVLTHEGWGNVPRSDHLWAPEGVPEGVGLQFRMRVSKDGNRLQLQAARDGRLADTFSLSTSTGLSVALSLITDMMRAAKEGSF